ncbi:MAG: protein kinase [Planctomycetes bacterium]|nr:protein kinase [Planctomycetota bacterium]
MTPGDADHYARVGDILAGARECRPDALAAYLDGACGEDAPLRAEVLELLALARDDAGNRDAFGEQDITKARLVLEAVVDGATDTWLPDVIGTYRIVRQIGRGGMGIVYEATQQSPQRSVAIKLLHPIQATPERLRRFRREAEMLGRLQHPGIAQIIEASTYDIGHGAQPFFAMELVDGVDIRTHCERAGLDQRARIELLAEVADAVDHAHRHGVVHRDLKPGNVLVDSQGRPRVLDFGIAHVTGDTPWSTMMTQKGQLIGTLGYMAPEQLTATASEVTPLADVYSLGVLGFELLTRRLPCDVADQSISKAIATLTTSEAPLASRFERSLRGDIDTILGKALEAEPTRRYASAAALASDLRRFLRHEPIHARRPSRTYLISRFTRRHRALVGGALATLFTLVAGTVTAIVFAQQARHQRDLAVTNENRATNSLLQSAQVLIDAGRGRDAVTQLRLVPETARGVAWRLLDRAVPFVVEERHEHWRFVDDEHLVTCSSDCVLVYSLLEHRTTRKLFAGAGITSLAPGAGGAVVGARTASEMLLLDLARERVLERSPVAARGTVLSSAAGAQTVRFPEVSDDGRTVLWYTSDREAEVRVDGVVVRVVSDLGPTEAVHLGPDGRLLVVNRHNEVSASDVASGAVRFRHAFGPGPGASGFPVRGGVLLHNAVEGLEDGIRRVWSRFDLTSEHATLEPVDPFASGFASPTDARHELSYSSDGRVVAVTPIGGILGTFLADPTTGRPLTFPSVTTKEHGTEGFIPSADSTIAAATVSPSGCRLVRHGGYAETTVVELDPRGLPDAEQRVMTLRGHTDAASRPGTGWIYHLAISHDGSLIASAAPCDPRIRVWDARSGELVAMLQRDSGSVEDLNSGSWQALMAFRTDDNHLLVTTPYGGRGLCLVDWDLLTGEVALQAAPLPSDTNHLLLLDRFVEVLAPKDKERLNQSVQMDGDLAMVVYEPPTPGLHEAAPPAEGMRWRYVLGGAQRAIGISVHPRLSQAAVAQQDDGKLRTGRLTVVDTRSGEVVVRREFPHTPMGSAYSPDGSVLAIGTNLGDVLLFETEHYTQQLCWPAHKGSAYSYVYSLAWTPDGTRLVTVSGDETVRIWDTRTRVASRLAEDRWAKLRAAMADCSDLPQVFDSLRGEEREAARVERIRRAHRR